MFAFKLSEMRKKKKRLDFLLVEKGLCSSLEKARARILAGEIQVSGKIFDKVGEMVEISSEIHLAEKAPYVSRGGLKLEGALKAFSIDVKGKSCLDLGSSTGGFTDCLLQAGANQIYAFDVGKNQMDYRLRNDSKIILQEGFNVRFLSLNDIPCPLDFAVIDVSFISLTKILPAMFSCLKSESEALCLIKPQFELPKEQVDRGGVIKDLAKAHQSVEKIHHFITKKLQQTWLGEKQSSLLGREGNREFFCWLKKK